MGKICARTTAILLNIHCVQDIPFCKVSFLFVNKKLNSSRLLKDHKISLSVKYLSCLLTIHGKRMHELSLLSTMYNMIFCYDSIIVWPTNPVTIPSLKDPLLFLLVIWTKVMAIYTTSVPKRMQLWVACHVKWLTFNQVSS